MVAEKQASLTVLETKILPMEDLSSRFQSWLSESEAALGSLSPPSSHDDARSEQLSSANVSILLVYVHAISAYTIMYIYMYIRTFLFLCSFSSLFHFFLHIL